MYRKIQLFNSVHLVLSRGSISQLLVSISFIYFVWLSLPFDRILKLQFIVQNGFLWWVDLVQETNGSGTTYVTLEEKPSL